MAFGLSSEDIQIIQHVISLFPEVKKTLVYGSRAKGTHKPGSDIDLALKGDLTIDTVSKIHYQLNEETNLPIFFDVLDYHSIKNSTLKDHIDRVGKSLGSS